MRERRQILERWAQIAAADEAAVLATVMQTEGSSYRLPGARLLLTQDGRRVGGVSGGCLEDDITKKAWWLTAQGPVVRRYDTTRDGELATDGYGLGCNGIIHVLLERVTRETPSVLPVLEAVERERTPVRIGHLLTPAEAVGRRVVVASDDAVSHNLSEESQLAGILTGNTEFEVFWEQVTPAVHLLVFGAGDDAIPLTQFAHQLGWRVSVFDGRAHYARGEKFPLANEVSVRAAGSSAPAIDDWTVAVVMTHSYSQDLDIVRMLAAQPLPYLGILGPRKRTTQVLEEAGLPAVERAAALHAPMGLDIGADGPEQVALAVTAEIQATMKGRMAGFLRDRGGPIHLAEDGAVREEQVWVRSIVCA